MDGMSVELCVCVCACVRACVCAFVLCICELFDMVCVHNPVYACGGRKVKHGVHSTGGQNTLLTLHACGVLCANGTNFCAIRV